MYSNDISINVSVERAVDQMRALRATRQPQPIEQTDWSGTKASGASMQLPSRYALAFISMAMLIGGLLLAWGVGLV